jgi:hypothetical protein
LVVATLVPDIAGSHCRAEPDGQLDRRPLIEVSDSDVCRRSQRAEHFIDIAVRRGEHFSERRGWNEHLLAPVLGLLHERVHAILRPLYGLAIWSFVDHSVGE